MSRPAPIVRITLAWAAGVAAGLAGVPIGVAPLLVGVGLVAPIAASRRPGVWRSVLAFTCAAGMVAGLTVRSTDARCAVEADGREVALRGRFLATPRFGAAPFEPVDGCGAVTVVTGRDLSLPQVEAGRLLRVRGSWRAGQVRPYLNALSVAVEADASGPPPLDLWAFVRWRSVLVDRIHGLFGEHGPLVSALVLARREGLEPEMRSAFASAGIAHLFAISGFHVGLVAGLVFSTLRGMGRTRRDASIWAMLVSWAYVGFIGFPAAATRAALILTAVAGAGARGGPTSRWAPLASAAFLLLVSQPGLLRSAGFQLSFAGAIGLAAWATPVREGLSSTGQWIRLRTGRGGRGGAFARALVGALATGVAATAATFPIVAWHFERVSLVGLPTTLVATPLVTLALPGALVAVALDFVWPGAAGFLAGGVSILLDVLAALTLYAAGVPWATAWVDRPTIAAAGIGIAIAAAAARRPGIGGVVRRQLTVVWVAAAVVAWPLLLRLDARGRLELLMIDVGQGDAVALRTPGGRWWLVDAGRPPRSDPGAHPVVRTLRRRGVRTLDGMVLTHPDGDHIGGAAAVIDHLTPRFVIDPMLPAPKSAYADLLEIARQRGVPWRPARAGERFEIDDVVIDVLHPPPGLDPGGESNAASVVLRVSWGAFSALLTGDAYVDVERAIAEEVGDIDVLKVGHHGSKTSTDSSFLAVVRPEVALVSAGRGNRYGHPAPAVLERLQSAGAVVRRTDREGTIRVVVRRDARYEVTAEGR